MARATMQRKNQQPVVVSSEATVPGQTHHSATTIASLQHPLHSIMSSPHSLTFAPPPFPFLGPTHLRSASCPTSVSAPSRRRSTHSPPTILCVPSAGGPPLPGNNTPSPFDPPPDPSAQSPRQHSDEESDPVRPASGVPSTHPYGQPASPHSGLAQSFQQHTHPSDSEIHPHASIAENILPLKEELRNASRAAGLPPDLLVQVIDAVVASLTAESRSAMETVLTASVDARARTDEVARALALAKNTAASSLSMYRRDLDHLRSVVLMLEQRVQQLLQAVNELDSNRQPSTVRPSSLFQIPPTNSESLKHIPQPFASAAKAHALISSLLLYSRFALESPAAAHRTRQEQPVPSSKNLHFVSKAGAVSEFHVALRQFLHILATSISPDLSSSLDHGTIRHPSEASQIMTLYGNLWRSVASPGRRGWKGEIIRAVLTLGDRELMAMVAGNSHLTEALAADLRILHALFKTPTERLCVWLRESVGLLEAPMVLPESGISGTVLDEEEDSKGDSTAVDMPQQSKHQSLTKLLHYSEDWGSEAVIAAVLSNILNGPSQVSSIADRFYGLRWTKEGSLEGVLSSEDVANLPVYKFIGIEDIRRRLCQNCEFLLNGLKSSNVHMYGPPGSGKSSCVMSLLSEYGSKGLRIIEVTKETLGSVPAIFEAISKLPQKFIVFIDDLTFEESESEVMRVAKAALEGSLKLHPHNVFILCTSNRRFPVGSRLTDATEEKLAFSYRFGITLAFPRTTRDAYLQIVRSLAAESRIVMPAVEMDELALNWALGQDGNANALSGRTARQFVDFLASAQALGDVQSATSFESSGNKHASSVPANYLWSTE